MAASGDQVGVGVADAGAADMTRSQRRWHLWLWVVLGPMSLAVLLAAVFARRPIPIQPVPADSEGPTGAGSP